jgi:hypothetical protein
MRWSASGRPSKRVRSPSVLCSARFARPLTPPRAPDAGTHPDFVQRAAVFEAVRLDSVAQAATQREQAVESVEHMYEYALHAAERACENDKAELRVNLLKDLAERLVDVQSKQRGQQPEAKAEKRVQRRLRSKAADGGAGEAGGGGGVGGDAPSSGVGGPSSSPLGPPLRLDLAPPESLADLKAVYRDWKATAARWRAAAATSLLPARVERARLYYGDDSFGKGEPVVVFSELTKQEFVGEVHACTPGEAIVKLEGGAKCRIPLQHLRHGRVSIYRYSPPVGAARVGGEEGARRVQVGGARGREEGEEEGGGPRAGGRRLGSGLEEGGAGRGRSSLVEAPAFPSLLGVPGLLPGMPPLPLTLPPGLPAVSPAAAQLMLSQLSSLGTLSGAQLQQILTMPHTALGGGLVPRPPPHGQRALPLPTGLPSLFGVEDGSGSEERSLFGVPAAVGGNKPSLFGVPAAADAMAVEGEGQSTA